MTAEQFIESGALEAYCLGSLNTIEQQEVLQMCLLYPSVKKELDTIQVLMEDLAVAVAVAPSRGIRKSIIKMIYEASDSEPFDIDNTPLTDAYTKPESWLNGLAHLIPEEPSENFFYHLLRNDEEVTQALVISKVGIPEETHTNLIESFYILKGRCKCTVGEKEYILNEGDFLEIPMHTDHDVVLLTPYVVAIHQQRHMAA